MRILVTGATGFVGNRLVVRLGAEGHDVVGTYRGDMTPAAPSGVQWRRVDHIGPQTGWGGIIEGMESIIHLAALAHQVGQRGEGRLEEFRAVNAEGTARLAAASASTCSVRRFIFVSSIGAVSSASNHVLDDYSECRPTTDYGRSKHEGELAVARVLERTGIDWSIVRPPLVYGPANPGNMARLTSLICRKWPLPFASIENRRSFIYVENLVDALATCVASKNRPSDHRAYFVTDGGEMSTAELTLLLARHLRLPVRLWRAPMALLRAVGVAGDVIERVLRRPTGVDSYSVERLTGSLYADGSRFREAFCWRPPFTIDEGIEATCAALLMAQMARSET